MRKVPGTLGQQPRTEVTKMSDSKWGPAPHLVNLMYEIVSAPFAISSNVNHTRARNSSSSSTYRSGCPETPSISLTSPNAFFVASILLMLPSKSRPTSSPLGSSGAFQKPALRSPAQRSAVTYRRWPWSGHALGATFQRTPLTTPRWRQRDPTCIVF